MLKSITVCYLICLFWITTAVTYMDEGNNPKPLKQGYDICRTYRKAQIIKTFIKKSGHFLFLFISLLLLTLADVAPMTYSMLLFKSSVCCCAKHSQTVVN